jgi:hypothetical protein
MRVLYRTTGFTSSRTLQPPHYTEGSNCWPADSVYLQKCFFASFIIWMLVKCWLHAMKNIKAQQKKTKSPKALFNLCRQRATAENLAKGMKAQEAMVAAGYSKLYAEHQGYKAVKRPGIQSQLTDSFHRIMERRQIQFDEIVEPYFDALKAPLIVKSTQLGDAYMPIEPKSQQPYPDHALRMDAADRIVDLFGGKPRAVEMPPEPPKGITIIFQKESNAKAAVVTNPTGCTSIMPEGETKHPKLPVTFVKPNGPT